MKAIYLLLTLVVIIPATGFSQYFTVDTFKGESPYNKQFSFIFPYLKSASNPNAASEVNKDMVKDILNIELGQQKRSVFENIWGSQDLDIANISDISFKVINNDADFFCISISATGCGAYCEDWTRYFARESSSGRKITLRDLFKSDGLQMISDSVMTLKGKRIQDRVAVMKEGLNIKPLSPEDKQDYATAMDLYAGCMKNQNSNESLTYSLDRKQITIYIDRCLPHGLRALDDVSYAFRFDLSNLKNYLTDYGKSLLKL